VDGNETEAGFPVTKMVLDAKVKGRRGHPSGAALAPPAASP